MQLAMLQHLRRPPRDWNSP